MDLVPMEDGVRLRTWTCGSPGALPPVVLVHGGPGLWDYLEPVALMLEPRTVVHRYDQRGCGGSDGSGTHTVARYVADLEALRRHWGHESWVVLGHSFGATLALAYAAAHPDATAALGYLSGVGVGDWRTPYRAERARRMAPAQRARLAELESRPSRSAEDEIEFRALSWFTDHADPEQGMRLALEDARVEHRINVEANALLNAEVGLWDDARILAQASSLTMPCWFVHGARDPRPVGPVARLADHVTGSRLHVLDGAGHQPWRERPEELAHLLGRLLESLRGEQVS